jgi:hypothetical protein
MRTAISWVKAKATPNLKDAKAETIVARPSVISSQFYETVLFFAVAGKVKKARPFVLKFKQIKLERLALTSSSSLVLCFADKASGL